MLRSVPLIVVLLSIAGLPATRGYDYALEQATIRQAVEHVADCVVQIRTVGGYERVGDTQVSQGPTTGLIVSADGYIVSSAFNFAQRPSSILVTLPGGKQVPAELVARDLNRMLVLLKVASDEPLPVPLAVPRRDIEVGQTAIALGRTFQSDQVDTSLGIISGVNRMHGRALQTDCNVSAANYGGPLVDLRGRVFGVLVPMSPQASGEGIENEVAGTEFYDSGIGFAVPLEHVYSVLPQWQEGNDLVPGRMGISMKGGSAIVEPPVIASVWPGSPAAVAGWQPGDAIIAVDGKAVATQNELQFYTKPLYAGDKLTISLRRGSGAQAEEIDSVVELVAQLAPHRAAFLGVLPATAVKDDKQPGVGVDGVWPHSPAATAGVKPGDRVIKLNELDTPDLAAARTALQMLGPDDEVEVTIARDSEETLITATLAPQPEQLLSTADLKLAPPEPTEQRELATLKLLQFPVGAKYLSPAEKPVLPGLVLWLTTSSEDQQHVARSWQAICDRDGLILVLAQPTDKAGWRFEDMEYLDQLTRLARTKFAPDRQRTVIVGSGKAGQLAYALGLRRRANFGGIVAANAPLPRTMKVPETSPTEPLSLVTVIPERSPLAALIRHDVDQLRAAGYPVSMLDRPEVKTDSERLDPATVDAIARWIAGLRRL